MEQNYELLAQSRANYYTLGSPVQFVRVELLKGEENGEIAVCLTFKNIAPEVVSGLVVNYKCMDREGNVLGEDQFYYENINAEQGQMFGSDDAVFVCSDPVGKVDVELDRMFLQDGSAVMLNECKRTRLPGPIRLSEPEAEALGKRTGRPDLLYQPQVMEEGWYCACGGFHPKAEDTAYCSECGSDRILLQSALSSIRQELLQQNVRHEPVAEEGGTRVVDTQPAMTDQERFAAAYRRQHGGSTAVFEPAAETGSTRTFDAAEPAPEAAAPQMAQPLAEEAEELDADDRMAENIIRWAPPVTAVLCVLMVTCTVVYHMLFQ